MEILTRDLSDSERELISKISLEDRAALLQPETIDKKTSAKSQITFMTEDDHKVDHGDNTAKLIEMIHANQIDSSTVICLERKEEGKNFGMRDVKLLAKLLEHNQANPESAIPINDQIKKSPIYQDAMLYNVAKEKGIEVIGLEGKGLEHAKESPEYNSTREKYMASQIDKIVASGKNVIFPVGSSHIEGLQTRLKPYKTLVDNEVALKNEQNAEFEKILKGFKKTSTEISISSDKTTTASKVYRANTTTTSSSMKR